MGITKLRQSTKIPADSAVAVLLSSGLAIGVVLIGLAGGFSLDSIQLLIWKYLVNKLARSSYHLIITAIVLVIMYKIYRKLMYIAFDEEQANVSGIDVTKLNYLFIVLASVTVITSLRLVGVLLISSLIVIPNITAMTFGKGFKKTSLISIIIAVLSVIGGIVSSYIMNLAPGGTIVIISVAGYLATIITKYMFNRIKGTGMKVRLEKTSSTIQSN